MNRTLRWNFFTLPAIFIFHRAIIANGAGFSSENYSYEKADSLACPCRIFLRDGTNITNVQSVIFRPGDIFYRFSGTEAGLPSEKIDRIEGLKKIVRQDSLGNILHHDYDILIGKGNDTLDGIIYSVSGNYISFQLSGKNKKGFIPLQAVKDFSWNSRKADTLHFIDKAVPVTALPGNILSGSDSSLPGKAIQADSTVSPPPDRNNPSGGIAILPEKSFIQPKNVSLELDCQTSYSLGMKDASSTSSAVLLGLAGCVSGCFTLSWVAPLISINVNNIPDNYPAGVNIDCYRLGYAYRKKKDNIMASTIGAGVSSVLLISIYIANLNSSR